MMLFEKGIVLAYLSYDNHVLSFVLFYLHVVLTKHAFLDM